MSHSTTTPPAEPETETLTSFKRALITALLTAARAQSVSQTSIARTMQSYGLPAVPDFTPGTGNFTVPEIEEETHIGGRPRSDFTAAALRRYDSEALHNYKRLAWNTIRNAIRYGELTQELALQVIKATGLPAPVTVYSVTVYVTGQPSCVAFKTTTPVSEEALKAQFLPLAHDPMRDAALAVSPDAQGLREPVRVTVSESQEWPSFPEHEPQAD